MSGDWAIDLPRTLFALPHPVDSDNGKIRLGRVWIVQSSRKRKRAEVVVAADGECVNIYSIKSPRMLATHALPPHACLTAAPACVYRPADENHPVQRFVYAAIRTNVGASRQEVVCFQEELPIANTPNAQNVRPTLKWTCNVTCHNTEIVHIEPLARAHSTGGSASHDLLLVFANGIVQVLPENLELNEVVHGGTRHSTVEMLQEISENFSCVEFVAVDAASDARCGLLKNRLDLATRLGVGSAVLLLITSWDDTKNSRREQYAIRICSISANFPNRSSQRVIRPLVSWSLPLKRNATAAMITGRPQFSYDKTSSSIYILDDGVLSVCKLSSTIPKLVASFTTMQGNGDYLLPVSGAAALVFSGGQCALYDSCYGSMLAAQTINTSTSVQPSSRKRKRTKSQDERTPVTSSLIYPNLGVVVGIRGYELVALRISAPSKARKLRIRNKLIDALGTRPTASKIRHSLSLATNQSLGLVSKSSASAEHSLERRFSEFKKLQASEKEHGFALFFEDILELFGPRLDDTIDPLARDLALKTMSVLFDWNRQDGSISTFDNSDSSAIKVLFSPPGIFEWLLKHGFLTAQNVERALLLNRSGGEPVVTVSDKDVVTAIAEVDPRLQLLASLVASRKLGLSGYVESFKLLIRSFDSPDDRKFDGLLEINRPEVGTGNVRESNEEFLAVEKAATNELQIATSILEDDSDARGSALKACLVRLGTCFYLPELVQTLRLQLRQHDIMMLVELLRLELEQAGWTSRRLDFPPSYNETENQNEAISVICKLLNCSLDAMGTVGWLAERQSLAADDISSQISLLREETSSALEGVQEATFFCGFLKDFIRFGAALGNSSLNSGMRMAMLAVLPFGLNEAQKVSMMRVGAGGELQQRSARRIGMELSQRIEKYSFETIRV